MESPATEFVIRPNAGYPPQGGRWWLLILVVMSMTIALRFAWLGFWMILPFTVIELGMLVVLMELVRRRGNYTETVRIGEQQVEVLHQQTGNNRDWTFPMYWTRVDLRSPSHHWYPHRLLIGSAGTWVEIGRCLTEEERFGLVNALRSELKRLKSKMVAHYA